MTDERKTIGSAGKAGRGNRQTSPSAAARALAGAPAAKKPVAKKSIATAKPPAGPPAAAKSKQPVGEPAAKKTAKPAAKKSTAKKATPPPSQPKPRLRAVTDEDAAAAAAAAAEEAAKRTRTAGAAPLSAGIPLDEIVVALIQAAQRVLGTDWEARVATLLATIRKRMSGDYEVDEFGFDPQITEVLTAAIEPLAEKWFRLEVRGVENIPAEGGALLVANHSGTVPIDGLITGYAVKKYSGRNLRPLGADLVFSLPFVGQIARKVGATLACTEDAERLLTTGELAGVWPEGFKGIGKPFAERYKLQRFGRGGFVSSAMRAQVPIVPVSIVGAEEIYPLVGNVPSLARLLGLPYLPITPFFPLLGPLGMIPLPSKWIIEFGEPIRTDAYDPESADDPMLLFNVTDQVRETIQQTLYGLLVDRGNAFF
ncbi:glycerol acyltransferase [Aeromicrobium sp. Root236]|uniref:lysophospholipid acyltransferase family protein n=1 Tax=Aeromicrobium sp. Root236 TaxID=1736498 RepID=UPI0006FE427B|nr:lysophospholipid acyltransferase family protein [Aeromicrobium sp. Root236]KRC64954.1 glycerol acyltransferase [Aeromicrobium sp. Root236]